MFKDGIILHGQERWAYEGEPQWAWKFRTMKRGSGYTYSEFVSQNGMDHTRHADDDPRVTRIGRFLRHYWIDELPQLWDLYKRRVKLIGLRLLLPKDFEEMPDDLKEARKKHKPALINCNYGVDYSRIKSGEFDHWEGERRYVNAYENDPEATDLEYRRAFLHNFWYEGLRGK